MNEGKKALRLTKKDTVAVALDSLPAGTNILGTTLTEAVERGHKFALQNISSGDKIIKYGYPIGQAIQDIPAGSHVHIHNMKTLLSETAAYEYHPVHPEISRKSTVADRTFSAFRRSDGRIGIRNDVWIIPTVGCVNKLAEQLAGHAAGLCSGTTVSGVYAWTHPYGCSQMGTDHEQTRTILADLVNHPNAGAVLVLGLGCENNTISIFKKIVAEKALPGSGNDTGRVQYLSAQDLADDYTDCMEALKQLIQYAAGFKREPVPVRELVIGMKCGGSDGLSGITANALAGQVCDNFTTAGSRVLLTEVPEMFGAEQLLMNRCINRDVFEKTVSLINGFKEYFTRNGQTVYENPSPGNKAGGITTLEDKSLGCVQKGGFSPVCGVLPYGETIAEIPDKTGGIYLLEGPGNDIVSTTAMTAAGVHLILFTTGRGTPLGAPVPTVKIASNRQLALKKSNWIDYDASVLLTEQDESHPCQELSELVLKTASGEYYTKNEQNGYREIAILKGGVTL